MADSSAPSVTYTVPDFTYTSGGGSYDSGMSVFGKVAAINNAARTTEGAIAIASEAMSQDWLKMMQLQSEYCEKERAAWDTYHACSVQVVNALAHGADDKTLQDLRAAEAKAKLDWQAVKAERPY